MTNSTQAAIARHGCSALQRATRTVAGPRSVGVRRRRRCRGHRPPAAALVVQYVVRVVAHVSALRRPGSRPVGDLFEALEVRRPDHWRDHPSRTGASPTPGPGACGMGGAARSLYGWTDAHRPQPGGGRHDDRHEQHRRTPTAGRARRRPARNPLRRAGLPVHLAGDDPRADRLLARVPAFVVGILFLTLPWPLFAALVVPGVVALLILLGLVRLIGVVERARFRMMLGVQIAAGLPHWEGRPWRYFSAMVGARRAVAAGRPTLVRLPLAILSFIADAGVWCGPVALMAMPFVLHCLPAPPGQLLVLPRHRLRQRRAGRRRRAGAAAGLWCRRSCAASRSSRRRSARAAARPQRRGRAARAGRRARDDPAAGGRLRRGRAQAHRARPARRRPAAARRARHGAGSGQGETACGHGDPDAAGRTGPDRRGARRGQAGHHRAARPGPRPAPAGAHRPRARRGAVGPRRPLAGADARSGRPARHACRRRSRRSPTSWSPRR